ncbi:MAG: hypothetical protein KC636_13525, partial [Myxococcales bacterium]|nr:hypothetical protein [Myxococcales bacterium]
KALLQAKVKAIAVRSTVTGVYVNVRTRDGDPYYYDIQWDALVQARGGWILANESDLLYVSKIGLTAGARYNLTMPLYTTGDDNPNGPTQRLGFLLAHTFYDRPEKRFNKPTLIVLAQWWLQHRYRTGQDIHQAVPWVVLGFRFEGDLWKKK